MLGFAHDMRKLLSILACAAVMVLPSFAQIMTQDVGAALPPAMSILDLVDDVLAEDASPDVLDSPQTGDSKSVPALAPVPVAREKTRVAVLGYHDFSTTRPVSDMLIRNSKFRTQMEYIKRNCLTVISMQEFLEWRFGIRRLPERCVLITIDDGWKRVYTEAYPILKEYGYPFTIFLYTDYLSGRGDSMTRQMVLEMQKNGATVGSHSKTHPYPSNWAVAIGEGTESLDAMIMKEIGGSHKILKRLFGPLNTYCYPGGYHIPEMIQQLPTYGYVAAFTVLPGKVTCIENPWQIRRYIILGNNDSIFDRAMDFRVAATGSTVSTGTEPGSLPASTPQPPFTVMPAPASVAKNDLRLIEANLSGLPGVDFDSLQMRVSGYGCVPAAVDRIAATISWEPPSNIYMPQISVHVTWKTMDGKSHKAEWSFLIDQRVTVQ